MFFSNLTKAVIVLTLIFTIFSCTKQDAFFDSAQDVTEVSNDYAKLTQELANNPNFQASTRILDKIEEDVSEFIERNAAAIQSDPSILEAFIAEIAKERSGLGEYINKWSADAGEFLQLEKDQAVSVLVDIRNLSNNDNSRGGCSCVDCYDWLDAADRKAAISQYRECKEDGGTSKDCEAAAEAWYATAVSNNSDWLDSCVAGDTECDFGSCGTVISIPHELEIPWGSSTDDDDDDDNIETPIGPIESGNSNIEILFP